MGRPTSFDETALVDFERLNQAWAPVSLADTKRSVRAALAAKQTPEDFDEPRDRHARAALRIALRQARLSGGDVDLLDAWAARFDRGAATDEAEDHA